MFSYLLTDFPLQPCLQDLTNLKGEIFPPILSLESVYLFSACNM